MVSWLFFPGLSFNGKTILLVEAFLSSLLGVWREDFSFSEGSRYLNYPPSALRQTLVWMAALHAWVGFITVPMAFVTPRCWQQQVTQAEHRGTIREEAK